MSDMKRKIAALAAFAMLSCAQADEQPTRAQPVAQPEAAQPVTQPQTAQSDRRGVVLFLGTSLTAGYGVGVEHAFPALVQHKLDSAGYPFRVVNAGLSGETSAGGLRRLEWSLQQPIDVLVLELGANDGLRGLPVRQLRANLDSIIAVTRRRYPDAAVIIAGMQAPPNLGAAYTTSFRATYRDLADKYDARLVPFLLEGVAAMPELNQEDGIHPNHAGHEVIAETIWQSLQPVLRESAHGRTPAARE
jgi:acyl-CoA thioesterase-1